ncbi:3-hydroxyacyl-CoA dehydrogenase [Ensifer aridi]|uniref:3-hydroxyacyl-CoA dehydrogenase n=1 Tax=Ensifer aridi TaxID=1708715 RepID=UPI0015E2C84B|nr:3-hydroxyacyl-CoA dehydrogenase [Ensifer aridi]
MTKAEPSHEFNKLVAVLGGGTMGRGIAEVALSAGHPVLLYNHRESTLETAAAAIRSSLARRVEKGRLSEEASQAQLGRLRLSTDLNDLTDASIIIESVTEDIDIKLQLLSKVERVVSKDTIIATNTSSLSVNRLSSRLDHPQRFIGLHFFNPAPLMKLVEIIPGNLTSAQVIAVAEALIAAWDKRSVTCKSTPGFLVNRIARPFYVEAFRLLDEGFEPPQTIDKALREAGGFRMGPLELTDLIGQDVNFQVTHQIWESMGYDPKYTPSLYQRSLVEARLLGRKSGTGVYAYGDTAVGLRSEQKVPSRAELDSPSFSKSITVYGEPGLLGPLVDSARLRGVSVQTAAATPSLSGSIGIDGGVLLRLTDGRIAEDVANQLARDVVLLDLALDFASVEFLLLSSNRRVSEGDLTDARNFLQLTGIGRPTLIDDTPGLVVARIVSCLINEASSLVQQRVSTPEEVEIAARLGVNYPLGLLEWRERLGVSWVESVMRNLSDLLHPTRYRPTPSFARSDSKHAPVSLAS